MNKISRCPVCGKQMIVKEYYCSHCDTTIRGEFTLEGFLNLSKDRLEFLYKYLSLRGNLRELGNQMGVSYPTIRVRFDSLLADLGISPAEKEVNEAVKSEIGVILEKIESGEMDSKEGIKKIKKIKRR